MSYDEAPADVRERLDGILARVESDGDLRARLASDPRATLEELGFDHAFALDVLSLEWGLGPLADCGHDTCRLTKECGWTVCGKTTNSCASAEDELRGQMDDLLAQVKRDPVMKRQLVTDPIEFLVSFGFDAATSRYLADEWGVGPAADCGSNTCRLTDACGWTVCGKTTNSCASAEDELRVQMDEVLGRVQGDPILRHKLVTDPIEMLASLGFEATASRYVADHWGIGPTADCGSNTCRLTDACGWTVCGKTTNSCASAEDELRVQMDDVLGRVQGDPILRHKLVTDPIEMLGTLGFDAATSRFVADEWGIGPAADCGSNTCRLTDACGWTVCGKTTNSCAGAS